MHAVNNILHEVHMCCCWSCSLVLQAVHSYRECSATVQVYRTAACAAKGHGQWLVQMCHSVSFYCCTNMST